jgi:hypothetical protein
MEAGCPLLKGRVQKKGIWTIKGRRSCEETGESWDKRSEGAAGTAGEPGS